MVVSFFICVYFSFFDELSYVIDTTGLCSGYHSDNLCVKKQLSKQWSKCPKCCSFI